MTKPDLNDPAQRAAYRRELQGVAKPLRYTGVAFALLGAVLAIIRSKWAPQMPSAIPLAALALGVLNMLAAIALRTRYHQQRMKSSDSKA
ncbi:MAG: hypothetical protein WC729_09855 [Sphingomonas sp.]|jgi:hypothetical protein|uniref:hypothetical protein n=1 Tax=Sphingomonas sp. TaxID=28214 RepID=UPI00356544BB